MTAKDGLITFTTALAKELTAHEVRVNAVARCDPSTISQRLSTLEMIRNFVAAVPRMRNRTCQSQRATERPVVENVKYLCQHRSAIIYSARSIISGSHTFDARCRTVRTMLPTASTRSRHISRTNR